jgi:uncharacterized membrane protein YgaE (UPF0421/DUF939 family)
MKKIISFGLGALIATLVVMFALPSNKKFQAELDRLHAQNDSLMLVMANTKLERAKLDSISNNLKSQVIEDKKQLTTLNKKANDYKKKYNEELRHIDSMSNNDVTSSFADAFE